MKRRLLVWAVLTTAAVVAMTASIAPAPGLQEASVQLTATIAPVAGEADTYLISGTVSGTWNPAYLGNVGGLTVYYEYIRPGGTFPVLPDSMLAQGACNASGNRCLTAAEHLGINATRVLILSSQSPGSHTFQEKVYLGSIKGADGTVAGAADAVRVLGLLALDKTPDQSKLREYWWDEVGPVVLPLGTTTPLEGCVFEGRVTDAGAEPGRPSSPEGHPLPGARINLYQAADGLQLGTTAAAPDGTYRLVLNDTDLPAGFDARLDRLRLELRLQESAHDPPRFEVWVEILGRYLSTSLSSDPFSLDPDCENGTITRDFLLNDIPASYLAAQPPLDWWPDVAEIYDRISRAFALADLLKQPMDYGPLDVLTACTDCEPEYAAWSGSYSSDPLDRYPPQIQYGLTTTQLVDDGWPDNRDYHEFGHHFTADSFGDLFPDFPSATNHGGYANPSSTDSWTEGLAEFFSMMVSKHIDEDSMPELYRIGDAQMSLELDYRPWLGGGLDEELAVAGLLLDLEDGPEDYAKGRERLNLNVTWHVITDDPVAGRLLIGEVLHSTPPRVGAGEVPVVEYSEHTMVAAQFRDEQDQTVYVGWAATVPWDLPGADPPGGAGGEGFFSSALPEDLEWETVEVVAFEGLPGNVRTDDDPVNLTLQEVWDTIREFDSTQPFSNYYLFDVADLHDAFKTRFGGRDIDRNGVDDIDQVFVAHGLYADPTGDRTYLQGDTVGWTDHPGVLPRRDLEPLPGAMVRVDSGGVAASILVQVTLPSPFQYYGYSYVARPDSDGRVHVAMPPPQYGGSATLIAVADGYRPAVAGTIDTAQFWEEVEAHGDAPFLEFRVKPVRGAVGPEDEDAGKQPWLLLGGCMIAAGLLFLGVRRLRRTS